MKVKLATQDDLSRFEAITKKKIAIELLSKYGNSLTESQKDIVRGFGRIKKDKLNQDLIDAHKKKTMALIRHIKKNKF